MTYFSPTDLIINPDGSSYHLAIRPDQVTDQIILDLFNKIAGDW